MLDKPVEEIVYEDGKVVGVKSQGEVCVCVCVCVSTNSSSISLRLLVAIVSLVTPATSLTRSRRSDRSVTCDPFYACPLYK